MSMHYFIHSTPSSSNFLNIYPVKTNIRKEDCPIFISMYTCLNLLQFYIFFTHNETNDNSFLSALSFPAPHTPDFRENLYLMEELIISNKLIELLENAARKQGYLYLIWESVEPLVAAMALYRNLQ